jgi:hypothetical protein
MWIFLFFAGLPFLWIIVNFQQLSALILFIISLSIILIDKKKGILSGLVLSCLIFKPHLILFILLFLTINKQWKTVQGLLTGIFFWCILSWISFGIEPHILWLESTRFMLMQKQALWLSFQTTWYNFFRYLSGNLFSPIISFIGILTSLGFIFGANIFLKKQRELSEKNPSIIISIAASIWIIASPYALLYDSIVAIPLILFCFTKSLTHRLLSISLFFYMLSSYLSFIAGNYLYINHLNFSPLLLTTFIVAAVFFLEEINLTKKLKHDH